MKHGYVVEVKVNNMFWMDITGALYQSEEEAERAKERVKKADETFHVYGRQYRISYR